MASSRAKKRGTQNQTLVKYSGIIIFIKRNTDVNEESEIVQYTGMVR